MEKTALVEEQKKILTTPKAQLIFKPPRVETEMYAVRCNAALLEKLREFCKQHELQQQEFMEWAIELSLKEAKAIAAQKLKEQEKPKKKNARTKVRVG